MILPLAFLLPGKMSMKNSVFRNKNKEAVEF